MSPIYHRNAFQISRLFSFSLPGIVGVEIRQMEVPSVIESGALPYVILDCNYDIYEQEGRHVDVKWFFGDDPQPFYQWIPGRRPQTRGDLFEGRLDLSYSIERAHRFKKHRALKIIRPTTELSGMYKCKVSSLMDEDFMQKKMVVYCEYLRFISPKLRTVPFSRFSYFQFQLEGFLILILMPRRPSRRECQNIEMEAGVFLFQRPWYVNKMQCETQERLSNECLLPRGTWQVKGLELPSFLSEKSILLCAPLMPDSVQSCKRK